MFHWSISRTVSAELHYRTPVVMLLLLLPKVYSQDSKLVVGMIGMPFQAESDDKSLCSPHQALSSSCVQGYHGG